MDRSAIIQAIKDLHERRQPLNLTAVRRSHPELLDRVFSIEPFWGWKQALADAGISYSEINVELLDYVTCSICGEDFGNLGKHLRVFHAVTVDEYRAEYPHSPLTSEKYRAARTHVRSAASGIPHWENLWTPEYVLDRLAALHRCGFAMNYLGMCEHERSLTGATLLFFESWDNAIMKIGLDPANVRLVAPGEYLSREEVIIRLNVRLRSGLPLNEAALITGDMKLWNAARRRFGNFHAALREAGIRHEDVRARRGRYSDEEIQELIAEVRTLAHEPDGWERIKTRYNAFVVNCTRLGNWSQAFALAGVEPRPFIGPRFPDRDAVLAGITKRMQDGLPVNAAAIFRADRTLYKCALREFRTFAEVHAALSRCV